MINDMVTSKVQVLVTVEVTHEDTATQGFINETALEAVAKNTVIGASNKYGMYKAMALSKEVLNLDTLQANAVNKYVSASLRASDEYY